MLEWIQEYPMFWPKIIASLIYIGVIVWAWFRPKSYIYQGSPNKKLWRDLRLWVTVIMCFQIYLYWYF